MTRRKGFWLFGGFSLHDAIRKTGIQGNAWITVEDVERFRASLIGEANRVCDEALAVLQKGPRETQHP